MKDTVLIVIPSHPKYLCLVRDAAYRMGEVNGIAPQVMEGIKLAVDEACANVIKHTYKGDAGKKVRVRIRFRTGTFEVLIDDDGDRIDHSKLKPRSLDDVRPGGLGVHFMKRAFDVVEFDSRKKKGNRLRLIKYFKEQ